MQIIAGKLKTKSPTNSEKNLSTKVKETLDSFINEILTTSDK